MKKLISVWGRGLWLPFFVLFLFWGLAIDGMGQSVECEFCDYVCSGDPLSEYVTVIDGTLINITGSASGSGTNLNERHFQGASGVIVFEFENGGQQELSFNVMITPQLAEPTLTCNGNGSSQIVFGLSNSYPSEAVFSWTLIHNYLGSGNVIVDNSNGTALTASQPTLSGSYTLIVQVTVNGCTLSSQETYSVADLTGVDYSLNLTNNLGLNFLYPENDYSAYLCDIEEGTTLDIFAVFPNSWASYNPQISIDGGGFVSLELPHPVATNFEFSNSGEDFLIQVQINVSGCILEYQYMIFIIDDSTVDNTFSASPSGTVTCAPTEWEIPVGPASENMLGCEWEFLILCGEDTVYYEYWTIWDILDLNGIDPDVSFFIDQSSCGCEYDNPFIADNRFALVGKAIHPCESIGTSTNEARVSINPDAGITSPLSTNPCAGNGNVYEFCYINIDDLNPEDHCNADFIWQVTCPDNTTTCTPSNNDSPCINLSFDSPGLYEIELEVTPDLQDCSSSTATLPICVNPDLQDLSLNLFDNAPIIIEPFCAPGPLEFPITFDPDQLFCDPLTIDWEITQDGGSFNANGTVDLTIPDGSLFDNLVFSPGEYTLSIDASIDDCDNESWTYDFTVWGSPDVYFIDNTPNCVGEPTNLGDWFCIRDSLSQIQSLSIVLYEGGACNSPGTQIESWDSSQLNDGDPCNFNTSAITWDSTLAGNFVLEIMATNECGTEVECLEFVVEEPEPLEFNLDENYCVGETLDLLVEIAGNGNPIPTFGQGTFIFDCPDPSNCPSPIPASNNDWITLNYPEGIYTITYELECYESVQFELTLNENPQIELDPDQFTLCEDSGLLILEPSASPPIINCSWIGPNGFSASSCDLDIPSPVEPGIYTLTGTTEFGCEGSDSFQVNIETFSVTGPGIQNRCNQEPIGMDNFQINFTTNLNYDDLTWSICSTDSPPICNEVTPDFTNNISLEGYEEGNYTLNWDYQSSLGCNYTGAFPFTITGLGEVSLGDDLALCLENDLTIPEPEDQSGNPLGGTWTTINCPEGPPCQPAQSSGNFTIDPSSGGFEAGDYTIVYSGLCIDPDTILITLIENPSFNIDAPQVICEGDSVTLSTDYLGADSYNWSSIPAEIIVNNTQSAANVSPQLASSVLYSLEIVANGCSGMESIEVNYEEQPWTDLAGQISFCDNQITCLNLDSVLINNNWPNPINETWEIEGFGSITGNTTCVNLFNLDEGIHNLVVTYESQIGCSYADTLIIEITGSEEISITNFDDISAFCAGEGIEPIFDNPDLSPITATLVVCPNSVTCNTTIDFTSWSPDVPGDYSILFQGTCRADTIIDFTVNPIPIFNLESSGGLNICPGDTVSLSSNYNETDFTCTWTDANGNEINPGDCSIEVDPFETTEYTLTINDLSCDGTNTIEIIVPTNPNDPIACNFPNQVCANDPTCLNLTSLLPASDVTSSDFTWTLNNELFDNFSICFDTLAQPPYQDDESFTLEYAFVDSDGCQFKDSCEFTITGLDATILLPNDDPVEACVGETISIAAQVTDVMGSWDFVTVVDGPGCNSGEINLSNNGNEITWSTSGACPGEYILQYSAICQDTATIVIELFPIPEANISVPPGNIVCAENEVTIEVEYLGSFSVIDIYIDTNGVLPNGEVTPDVSNDPLFSWTFPAGSWNGIFELFIEDETPCPLIEEVEVLIQEVDFDISNCDALDGFCANSNFDIDLESALITGNIPDGTFSWFLIDMNSSPSNTLSIGESLNPSDYSCGNYVLYYDFLHDADPNCIFSDSCSFAIECLTTADITHDFAYCQNSDVLISAENDNGITSGTWEVTGGPNLSCITPGPSTSWDAFSFNPEFCDPGIYTIQYSGECLETQVFTIEILSIPIVSWTPIDDTPCLNLPFDFSPEILENISSFNWTYNASIINSPYTFVDGNPGVLCLNGELEHTVQGTVFTCLVGDCETIDPVESPNAEPTINNQYCAGETIQLNIDDQYSGCEFTSPLGGPDCDDINLDPNGPYGTFPYTFTLTYGGSCEDVFSGETFIPEPPSADLSINFDPCVPDVTTSLPQLSGDNLSFEWSVGMDDPQTDITGLILDDSNDTLPDPNPIPLSDLGWGNDTIFHVGVQIFNPNCANEFDFYSIALDTTGIYIAPPDLNIDIVDTSGNQFCPPVELAFEAFVSTTQFIDSVSWSITSSQSNDIIYSDSTDNTGITDSILFENLTSVTDTITIATTVWGRCGEISTEEEIYIVPDSVFVKIPDNLPGACGGQTVTFNVLELFGVITDYSITAQPNIPGLNSFANDNFSSYTVTIPESTVPDEYELTLIVEGCGNDSDFTNIRVFPDPQVSFETTEDACTGDEVFFTNTTEGAITFEWDFGDGQLPNENNSLANPIHLFQSPGTYYTTLTATSDSGCVAMTIDSLFIYGPNPNFRLEENKVCSGTPVFYEMPENDFLIDAQWEFLLPGVDTIVSIADTNRFITLPNTTDETQNWIVSLTLTDEFGCVAYNDTSLSIFPLPIASFTYDLNANCAIGEVVQFDNIRQNNVAYEWDFGDPESGFLNQVLGNDPEHLFSGMGEYVVTMTAKTTTLPRCEAVRSLPLNCIDGIVFVPNAFTPDENGINDVFKPTVYGLDEIDFGRSDYYSFIIFDRWGRTIWETNDPEKGWNGQSPDDDYYAQSEMYSWRLEIKYPEETKEWAGSVVLLK